ncbi:MFS transporter [Cyanobacterium aponinum UTEX 3222]|uniref:Major facilitator superfamily MFS_1 n=2 Tax=Cyanobacterium aponinum TaxID=379064 RepID=K9Z6K5_CYAAP|nr:MFS transporter [Cyanobacterium aponinum]WRL43254.1 MFS transporter [Cyanobacterium aponinum UTEX 3222]AFZ54764.1 major facilitator superfamily MFS_1 [Cyanobacterium aponinum PCC 10605]MBD2392651.1 MFS transporter [Cyanobacterium aponinum FACHB-4101]PHV64029.1 MFS transporter [Cyanobacterium aponinum IPPAS B-1201]WPF87859.1 MFS transporter [Cyanobacterium aponinum AL20115]
MPVFETDTEEKSEPVSANSSLANPSPTHHKANNGIMSVLRNISFLILWLGQIFSQLADKIYLVLMIALISANFQTQGESISSWVSLIMIAFTIPAILFGSLAGVYVDRWSKKSVLVVSNLGRGILVLILPFCLLINKQEMGFFSLPWSFWLLLLVTFSVSTLTQFFAPAEQATIPLIVRKKDLLAANSLYTTTMMAMLIIGFAVGEPLLEITYNWGENFSFAYGKELLVGGCYLLAGIVLMTMRSREKDKDRQQQENHPWEDIKDGLRYLQKNHRVRNALFQLVILFSIFAALAVLAVRLAETIPGMEADQFGYLLAATGIGIAIGAVFVTHQGKMIPHARLSFWGSMGMGAALSGLSVATNNLILALLMTVILGIFAALVGVPMQTTIQAETPSDMRGKVFGLQNNAVNIALSLPLALAGIAETYFGLRIVLMILASLAVSGMALTSLITGKSGN